MSDPITFRDLLRLMAKGFVFKFGNSPAAEQVEDALRRAADTIDGLRDRVVAADARLALADAVVDAAEIQAAWLVGVHNTEDLHAAIAAYRSTCLQDRAEVKP